MSENNRPDSEQKNEQTSAEDILAQVDGLIADLENTTATQLYAAAQEQAEAEKSAEPSATESPTEQPPDQPLTEEAPPGEPEDISSMVRYLASDEAKHITGSVFVVDGGFSSY